MHGSVLKSLSYRVSKVKLMNNNSYTKHMAGNHCMVERYRG